MALVFFFRVTSAVMALTGMASWMDSIACLSFRGELRSKGICDGVGQRT